MENNFTITDVAAFWDKVAEKYDSTNLKFEEAHYQRFREAVKHLNAKKGARILNIWSRTGNAIPFLKEKFPDAEIINMEVSDNLILLARQKFPDENFMKTDLENISFENDFFDAVLSLETLEHAPKPLALIKELHRVLKPEGKLVMSLPPKTARFAERISFYLLKNHGEGPYNFLPSKTVKKLLAESGFKLILHKGTLLFPFGPKWFRNFGEKIIARSNGFIRELGIRQFYVARK